MKDFVAQPYDAEDPKEELFVSSKEAADFLGVDLSALSIRPVGDDAFLRLGGRKVGIGTGKNGRIEYPASVIRKIKRVMALGFGFAPSVRIVAFKDDLFRAAGPDSGDFGRYQCYEESIRMGFEPKDALIRARNFC